MNRRLLIVLCTALFAATTAMAQQSGGIKGTVKDETGGALPGVTVSVSGPASRSAVTAGDGSYHFDNLAAGSYKVTAYLSGFSQANQPNVAVAADATADVPFTLSIAGLGETVVVSASKLESTIQNAPVTMSVITSETIQNSASQNFGDLLREVPGVNVIQTSARDINLTSRQGTSTLATSQLVLLDGRSMYLDFFGLVLWDLVPNNMSEIKQIEVVRGPASAVWGANALTGVVNIITKTPRESQGTTLALSGGMFNRDGGSREKDGSGNAFGANLSIARAPSDKLSYRIAGGYFQSDPFSRPTGQIPIIADPRVANANCTVTTAANGLQVGKGPNCIGGALYPTDETATPGRSFENDGTKQPKVDVRVDQELSNNARITYNAGYAGTTGIVHTGIGPFNLQSGSYLTYGKVGYSKNALKISAFANILDAEAPNLLLTDPTTLKPVALNFKTQTYDLEVGHSSVLGGKHVLTYGGNVRRNNFEITLTPNAENRTEAGAYFEDEFLLEKFRLSVGGRVDKFGNIDKAVFSPRISAMFKPTPEHSFRVSFNKAFRAPSAVNNFLDQKIFAPVAPIDLRPLAGLIPLLVPGPGGQFLASKVPKTPISLIVNNVGNPNLKQESIKAYEISYTGSFNKKTTIGLAAYQNDSDDNINFTQVTPSASNPRGIPPFDVYTVANSGECCAPTGIDPLLYGFLLQARIPGFPLPRTVSTYLNLGPLRQRGFEASIDHRFNSKLAASANYSYQEKPKVLKAAANQIPYLTEELALPAKNRFNASLNWNAPRFFGSAAVNYVDKALWTDVLSSTFHGFTDSYTLVNASFGMKWSEGKLTTTLKGTNLLNQEVQQHVFGDLLKRSIFLEARLSF